jgi:signal transduction histidine kinase/ligand-binding sensor domain-containing protein
MEAYGIVTWDTDDGLPQKFVRTMAQTADGYLWLGTQAGLARFDGNRFVEFRVSNTPSLRSDDILVLAVDAGGRLWVGSRGGLTRADPPRKSGDWHVEPAAGVAMMSHLLIDANGDVLLAGASRGLQRLRSVQHSSQADFPEIMNLLMPPATPDYRGVVAHRAPNGDILVWSQTLGIQRLVNDRFEPVVAPDVLGDDSIFALMQQRDKSLWFGLGKVGVVRVRHGMVRKFGPAEGFVNDNVTSLLEDTDGNIWIGTFNSGLFRFSEAGVDGSGKFHRFPAGGILAKASIRALLEDRERNIWVGTVNGVHRLREAPIVSIGNPEGLGGREVWSVREQTPGVIWAGAEHGLFRLEGQAVKEYGRESGLDSEDVNSMTLDGASARLWVGTIGAGVRQWDGGRFEKIPLLREFDQSDIYALFRDSRDRLWIGASLGDQLHYVEDGELYAITPEQGWSGKSAWAFAEDTAGAIWIGTRGAGLFRLGVDGQMRVWTREHGLVNDTVRTLHADAAGGVWIATAGVGLNRVKNDHLILLAKAHGLLAENIVSMLEDVHGKLWLCTSQGLHSVPIEDLNAVADGKKSLVVTTSYGKDEGMRARECSGGNQPAAWKAADGTLWFATEKGLAKVSSDYPIPRNTVLPPVHIEELLLDGGRVEDFPADGIPADRHRVGFRFTALSLQAPSRIRFRYRLEGFDKDWVDGGSERSASYTNLAPGGYRFRVIASNNDGVWNTEGASIAFDVRAPFYQTRWFYVVVATAIFLLGGMLHRLRLRELRSRNAVLDERARLSRELHDNLSQTMTGIVLQLDAAQLALSADSNGTPFLDRARQLARDGIAETRRTLHGLRPAHLTGELDLAGLLRQNFERLTVGTPIAVSVAVCGTPTPLATDVELALFRIGQEAATNALRHTDTRAIEASVSFEAEGIRLRICDDGQGFDPNQKPGIGRGLGLGGMRARVEHLYGQLRIESNVGQGTCVDVFIPTSTKAK